MTSFEPYESQDIKENEAKVLRFVCTLIFLRCIEEMDPNDARLSEVVHLSLVMSKPAFCICKNKDADQLRGNREADQRLCFRYTDSTIPLLLKSEIPSL